MLDWLVRPSDDWRIELAGRTLPVVLRRLPQARRMTLRLAPDGSEVRVSLPRWGRSAEALAFARSRADWLERQLAALPVAAKLEPGSALWFRGETLTIRHDPSAARRPRLEEGEIVLGGPLASLPARLQRWLEGEARTLFAADLADYCTRLGRPLPRFALSRAQRRWGSCAPTGVIRLNWRLVMAPDAVRRSVVAHEVAHLAHMNHAPAFHALLRALFAGDLAAAEGWLRHEGRALYAPFG